MTGFRRTRAIYFGCMCCLFLASGAVIGIAVLFPIHLQTTASRESVPGSASTDRTTRPTTEFSQLEPLMNRRLQGAMVPLVPAASETITAPQPEQSLPPLPDVRLLGTARDSDSPQSTAWLKTPTNTVILAQEGETIAKIPGAPVLKSVDIGRVVLLFGDREMVLEMKAIIRER